MDSNDCIPRIEPNGARPRASSVTVWMRRRRIRDDGGGDGGDALALKWSPAAEHLVEDDAERPDIGPGVRVLEAADLLGGHVMNGPGDEARGGEARVRGPLGALEDLGEPEIEDLDERCTVGSSRKKEVLGFEVAVEDAAGVGLRDGESGLEEEVDGLGDRQWAALLEDGGEIGALEVLQDHVRSAVIEGADVEDAGDVLAFERGGGSGLAQESGTGVGELGGRREEEFDRDAALQDEVPGREDDSHAARAEDAFDAVFPGQDVAGPGDVGEVGRGGRHGTARIAAGWGGEQDRRRGAGARETCSLVESHRRPSLVRSLHVPPADRFRRARRRRSSPRGRSPPTDPACCHPRRPRSGCAPRL